MKLLKCIECRAYTLKPVCQKCGEKTINPRPPKYSIEDKYANYRRKQKYG